MTLKSYLEMMPAAERQRAFAAGQSNLDPAKVELKQSTEQKKTLSEKEMKMLLGAYYNDTYENVCDKLMRKTDRSIVSVNNLKRMFNRAVMTWDGTIYSADANKLIHAQIIWRMIIDGALSGLSDRELEYFPRMQEVLKKFICLQQPSEGKSELNGHAIKSDDIFFGESYGRLDLEKVSKTMEFKHYKKILKDKYGLNLIAEMY